ncbi:hypothetical protein DA798_10235 [Lactobacillus sp. PFC-70]|nr:hypothetical protein DA798_10235 [Lactobacillus sp. PFC-70]
MLSGDRISRREKRNKVQLMTIFFWIAFFLSIGLRTARETVLSAYIPQLVFSMGIIVSSTLILIKVLLFDRMNHRQLFFMVAIFFTTFIVSQISKTQSLFANMLLILGCLDIPFKKIIRNYVYLTAVILIIAYLTTIIGLTKNYEIASADGIKYAMGGNYPTDFAAHIFYLLCAYVYMRATKLRLLDVGPLIIGLLLVGFFTKTQADTIAIFLLLIFVVIYTLRKWLMKNRYVKQICMTAVGWSFTLPGVFAVIIYWLTATFNYGDKTFIWLNQLLTNRLNFGSQAFDVYGVKLFGQPVLQNGWGGARTGLINSGLGNLTYFYIDSSYISMLIIYGFFFTALVLCGLMIHLYVRLKDSDILYALIWIPILLVSVVDQHLLEVQYNIFLLGIFAYFEQSMCYVSVVPRIKINDLRHW